MAILLTGLGLQLNQSTALITSCASCHKVTHPAIKPVNHTAACQQCHTYTNWQVQHYGGMSLFWTDNGSFYTPHSQNAPPALIHLLHSGFSLGGFNFTGIQGGCACHQSVSCTYCHSTDCGQCHGQLPTLTHHTTESLANGNHSALGCSSCHNTNDVSTLHFVNGTSTANIPELCRQCHYSAYDDLMQGKHHNAKKGEFCTDCHSPHQPLGIKTTASLPPINTGLIIIISSIIIVGALILQAVIKRRRASAKLRGEAKKEKSNNPA
jgi:hypothetical protein